MDWLTKEKKECMHLWKTQRTIQNLNLKNGIKLLKREQPLQEEAKSSKWTWKWEAVADLVVGINKFFPVFQEYTEMYLFLKKKNTSATTHYKQTNKPPALDAAL